MSEDPSLAARKAALLERLRRGEVALAPPASAPTITAGPPLSVAPASLLQEDRWLIFRREPTRLGSTISFAAFVNAPLDEDAACQAIEELGRRHETLRTSLTDGPDGVALQHIDPEPVLHLQTHDLTPLPVAERDTRAVAQATALLNDPFDLGRSPLARTAMFRLGDARSLLVIAAHHVISDGWSLGIALNEFSSIYLALATGGRVDLDPLPIQYRDYAAWQRRWLASEASSPHRDYWTEQLRGHVSRRLPGDVDSRLDDEGSDVVEQDLPDGLSEAVRRLAGAVGASPFMILLAAVNVVLAEATGQPEVMVATPVANRRLPETHGLIGYFADTVILRQDLGRPQTFAGLVDAVRATSVRAIAHEDYTLSMYLNEVELERDPDEAPLYSLMVVHRRPLAPPELHGATLEPVELKGPTRNNVSLHLWTDRPVIHAAISYSRRSFSDAWIKAFWHRFAEILRAGVAHPDRAIGKL